MRLISFLKNGSQHVGKMINETEALDVTASRPGIASLQGLLETDTLSELQSITEGTNLEKISDLDLLPVIPNPSKVICVGINYVAHAAEAGRKVGDYPVIFQRYADTLVGHRQNLVCPIVSEEFDFEGELAVIIGKGGRHIRPEDAMSHVAGFSCFNDASVRDWQFHSHQYGMGKNFQNSGALGPEMVTADEIRDYRELEIESFLNGEKMQEGKLSQLAFDIPAIISYVSKAMAWRPGDVIATGTPSGVGFKRKPPIFLKEGDVFDVSIPGVGRLSNPVVSE